MLVYHAHMDIVKIHLSYISFGSHLEARGGHSIVKRTPRVRQKKSTFSKLHHKNGSQFYHNFLMSRYTKYLLHTKNP